MASCKCLGMILQSREVVLINRTHHQISLLLPRLLVITGGVTGQLEDFGGQILHHSGQVDGSAGSHTFGVISFAEHSVNTTHGELESSTAGAGLGLSLNFTSFTTSRHFQLFSGGLNEVKRSKRGND